MQLRDSAAATSLKWAKTGFQRPKPENANAEAQEPIGDVPEAVRTNSIGFGFSAGGQPSIPAACDVCHSEHAHS